MAKKEYTPEEIREYNNRKQAEIDEMIQRIDEGVNAVFESEKYKEYLKFASKFTDYSARNTMRHTEYGNRLVVRWIRARRVFQFSRP